jgi:hypothetical protein
MAWAEDPGDSDANQPRRPPRRRLLFSDPDPAPAAPSACGNLILFFSLGTKDQPKARRLAARLNVLAEAIFDAALADPATGLDQLKRNFREALAEDLARSRLPSQIDTVMSMQALAEVTTTPGLRGMSLPADGGTDPTKKERNPPTNISPPPAREVDPHRGDTAQACSCKIGCASPNFRSTS